MKKMVKALWAVYAAALCFGFFQTTAAVSALLGLSEGQYVFLNGGLLAGFVFWAVYAAALCFGFFQTTAAVSALLGLSEGQYVFLNGGLLAGFVFLIILPAKLFGARRKTGRHSGKKKDRMHGRRRGGVRPAAVCTAAFCLTAVLLAGRIIHIPAGGLHMGPHSETLFWGNLFCQVFGSVEICSARCSEAYWLLEQCFFCRGFGAQFL